MSAEGADSGSGNELPFGAFGDKPIDRSSIAPRPDAVPVQPDPIDDIPFDEGPPFDPRENWDADDERRQRDQFAPPRDPCECYCLHCHRTFMSDQIWFQSVTNARDGFEGFWMCPTNNCSGAGFTFDIFPTDPNHPANAGWYDDDDDDEDDEDDYDPELDEDIEAFDPDDVGAGGGGAEAIGDYDPAESKYRALDEQMGDADNDIAEGDEWKLGIVPGEEVPPQVYWSENARKEWEKEQEDYDAPDRRPRKLDWSQRDDDNPPFNADDIPF